MNHPELFSKYNFMSKAAAVKYLKEYAGKLKWRNQNESIIDMGCGDGAVTNIIKKYVPKDARFVASDVSESMVEFARKKYSKDNITFRVLDIEGKLPNELKHDFNHVVSIFALQFVMNQEKAFKNFYNLLKDGGDCFFCFLKYLVYYDLYAQVFQDKKWKPWIPDVKKGLSPYYYFSKEDSENKMKKIMESVGFTNIQVKCENMKHVMQNGSEFKNLLRAVEPYKMPDDVFEDFAKDSLAVVQQLGLIDKTCTKLEEHDKTIELNYQVLVGYGSKP